MITKKKEKMTGFTDMIISHANAMGLNIDKKNPIREIKQEKGKISVYLNEKPHLIKIECKVGAVCEGAAL